MKHNKESKKEMEAAKKAYKAGLGAGEWEAFMDKKPTGAINNTEKLSWEDEFDEKFVSPKTLWAQDNIGTWYGKNDIKQFIQTLLAEQQQEFKKTLNSGRAMYCIGRKDAKEEIREYCLDERDKAEKEKYIEEYNAGYFNAMNTVVKFIDSI